MKIRESEKFRYKIFLEKAGEFHIEMLLAKQEGRWNAVGLNGVHCVISASDALTTYFLGKRSAGERHEDAAELLSEIQDINRTELKEKVNQLLGVLQQKNLVEYAGELLPEPKAILLAKQAERIYEWAKSKLPR